MLSREALKLPFEGPVHRCLIPTKTGQERKEGRQRTGKAEEKKALSPLSITLRIQRLKLNPAIKFIASDSQAGENTTSQM